MTLSGEVGFANFSEEGTRPEAALSTVSICGADIF